MGSPTTIGVNNDLSSSETRVSLGSTNNEGARGVDDDLGVLEELSGANLLDDLFSENLSNLLLVHGWVVLGRDENIVDANRLELSVLIGVLDDNLRLAVRSQPWDGTGVSCLGHFFTKLVGEPVRVGVEGL
jgi:hypothetical protein